MDKEHKRMSKEIIRRIPREFLLWLKSLNWNKEDYKKIIIGILLIVFAAIFIKGCPGVLSTGAPKKYTY